MNRFVPAVVALGALAAAASAGGCKKEPAPPAEAVEPAAEARDAGAARAAPPETAVVEEVAIRRVDPPGAPGKAIEVDDRELAKQLGRQLAASEPFAAPDEPLAPGRVAVPARAVATVSYDLVDGTLSGRSVVIAVEAAIEWQSGERLAPRANILVERPVAAGEQAKVPGLTIAIIEQAIGEAGAALVAKEALRQGGDAGVVAALGGSDPDLVSWALELVAARRIAAGFDRAAALLDSPDPGVSGAALRALVALGDPRGVEPLARRAEVGDPSQLQVIIEAVSAIGGQEAAEFLELMATGHPDDATRARAAEALERVKRQSARRGR